MSRKMQPKATSRKKATLRELSQALLDNGKAWDEGPKRKMWSKHDLPTIHPLTPGQEDMFHSYINNYNICAYGSAGTGKTFVALYLALNDVLNERTDVNKIIIVRSAVPTRDIGFLPGKLAEKMAPYEIAYDDILYELFDKPFTYRDMCDAGLIQFYATSFLRGLSWYNAVIIIEEIQNMNEEEIHSVMTRVGHGSRVLVLGDIRQNDLQYSRKESSGMPWFLSVIENMPEFAMIKFTYHDVVRGDFVKSWIQASEQVN